MSIMYLYTMEARFWDGTRSDTVNHDKSGKLFEVKGLNEPLKGDGKGSTEVTQTYSKYVQSVCKWNEI